MTYGARVAGRSRFITLTRLPQTSDGSLDFQPARQQVRDLVFRLRRDGYASEWAWAIERNPQQTGFHTHLIQHGDFIPQAVLQERWGGRIVHIEGLRKPAAGTYTVKEAIKVAGYIVKNGRDSYEGLSQHLAINGHRAAHFSRGFLHGLTAREALKEVSLMMNQGELLTYHFEPAWTVPSGQTERETV